MLVDINKVTVGKRIRKDYGDITSLADDIEDRGLINPPVVTPDYELIAGERRLKAMKKLDYRQIEVRVMSVEDYEHQLKIEISENEERKAFTYSERMDYAKQLERIEAKKAKDRKTSKLKQNKDTVTDQGPERKGETRDIVGKASGFGSGRTYARAKYIYENADEETIKEVDEGKKSIRKAHDELRAKEKQNEANKVKVTTKEKPQTTVVDRRERMNAEVEAMSETETNLALSEAAAANIVNVCSNLLYAVNNIEDLELTLNFLKSRDAEELSKVVKASKALNKIIEKGDFINV
ncbi:TPA: ParB N-terminal domain-containing protein [Staphylococcus aureus]|uniref:ParB N-terminal domain-containing protein n=1 Tax=Staphylococcus aureus TaxID=1280 RepID=UPI0008068559|nr:ParB N-terminal domain-containing protein [Staphylococcus aureus]HAR6957927.1 ParB N-terminal domain-containing protein [Staphylococcus aureus]HCU7336752.1 ParB N-terminal domain-containing protein [Staphylococcus aureus]HDA3602769.1 ParB N-terminal domain-containing protein [Staphylococcus aureus]HDF6558626.1 ParB N-terminal domain-containing protein [Staphylococcus aureus]HDY5866187.1 ParB N-terminal domain-containing protein [Staphylococcus aureus]